MVKTEFKKLQNDIFIYPVTIKMNELRTVDMENVKLRVDLSFISFLHNEIFIVIKQGGKNRIEKARRRSPCIS